MIKYNPLFHHKALKLRLPIDDMSNIDIHKALLGMGYLLPVVPDGQKVVGYILQPAVSRKPSSFVVVDINSTTLSVTRCYKAGIVVLDSFDADELSYKFFKTRYGRD